MDILAARKKAAEQGRRKTEQERTEVQPEAAEQTHPEASEDGPAETAASEIGPPAACGGVDTGGERAAEEAEPAATTASLMPELEMLSFRLGHEEYAVMVEEVKEVLKNRELTPVPNAPDYVLGITSVRGVILPVIDLCRRLGIPARERDAKSRILVVDILDENSGIVVDRVTGVVRIPSDAITDAPENIERGAEFLRGIARKDDKLYILLDMEKTLGAQ